MPFFDASKYYKRGSYATSIREAREDLERDFSNGYACVFFRDQVSVHQTEGKAIFDQSFELHSYNLFCKTYGYRAMVFEKAKVRLEGKHNVEGNFTLSGGAIWRDGAFDFCQPKVLPSQWMSKIDGKSLLSDLTIPATHNSHARPGTVQIPDKFKYLPVVSGVAAAVFKSAECQSLDIIQQLNYGVRMIDLRLGPNLSLRHGLAPLTGDLDEVLEKVANFLLTNKTETVLINVQWDYEEVEFDKAAIMQVKLTEVVKKNRHDEPPELLDDVMNACKRHGIFYNGTKPPTLDEVRGKMILFPNFKGGKGVSWQYGGVGKGPEGRDRFERKWNEFIVGPEAGLSRPTGDGNLYSSWLNGYDLENPINGTWVTPEAFAQKLNPSLDAWVREKLQGRKGRMGIVHLDFVYDALAILLWRTNFDDR